MIRVSLFDLAETINTRAITAGGPLGGAQHSGWGLGLSRRLRAVGVRQRYIVY